MYPRFFKCQSVDSKLVRSRFATLSTASLVSRCLASAETARCTSWFGIKNIAAKAFARRSMSRGAQGPLAIAKCAPTSQSNNRWHSSWARVNRRPSGLQRRPCSVPVVSRWKPFLVKQWIPVVCKPLHQGKQVPVGRIRPLTILLVGAQIPTLDPQLEATPREAGVRLHRLAIIGVWSERQPQCEFAGVPGKPLPSSAHLLARSIPVRSARTGAMPAARRPRSAAGCRPGSCGSPPPEPRRSGASAQTASAPTPSRGRSSA